MQREENEEIRARSFSVDEDRFVALLHRMLETEPAERKGIEVQPKKPGKIIAVRSDDWTQRFLEGRVKPMPARLMKAVSLPLTTPKTFGGDKPSLVFSSEESRRLFDDTARSYLNISGDEFLRRWDAGYYSHPDEDARVRRVAFLMPMVRSVRAGKNVF